MKKNLLLDKMRENFDDLADFVKRSHMPVSMETVRRALYEGKAISIPSLILIAKYLRFTPNEIKQIIQDAGDVDFSELIGDQNTILQPWEKAILEASRQIVDKKGKAALNVIADQLALVAGDNSVTSILEKIRTKKRRR